jgi:ATP/ADP translocase
MWIFMVWVVASGLGTPILLGLNASTAGVQVAKMTECKFYNSDFIILSSLASFYIPCVIILVLYYKIMKAIMRHDRRIKPATGTKKKNKDKKKMKKKKDGEKVLNQKKVIRTSAICAIAALHSKVNVLLLGFYAAKQSCFNRRRLLRGRSLEAVHVLIGNHNVQVRNITNRLLY